MHPLKMLRLAWGLSVEDLAELSGIAPVTIYRIEDPDWTQRFNQSTARALADALYVQVSDIFDTDDLTHLGRPALTGVPCQKSAAQRAKLCPKCFVEVPLASSRCESCDIAVA